MCLIHSVQSVGYKKSAISGIQVVIKEMNCVRTYENGVWSPYNTLDKKVLFVKTSLKNYLIF